MALSLKSLITIAPVSEETRKTVLSKLDGLTDDQKYRLAQTAWKALAQQYYTTVQLETQKYLQEVQRGEKEFSKKEIEQIQASALQTLTQHLETTETKEDLAEIRQQLAQHSNNVVIQGSSQEPTVSTTQKS